MTSLDEAQYRDLLFHQIRSLTPRVWKEAWLYFGRADVLTSRHVIEVEPVTRWRKGLRQLLAYAHQRPDHEPVLALFGEIPAAQAVRIFNFIDGYVTLWFLAGSTWCEPTVAEIDRDWIADRLERVTKGSGRIDEGV